MENRGYEEEQHQRERRDTENRGGQPRESPLDDAIPEPSSPDGHVYEDVSPKMRDVFDPPSQIIRDPGNEEIPNCFRRNLTLPFRRGNGLDPVGPGSSVRVTSREKHPPEDVSREPRETSKEFRPARRRRKKDCKHCRGRPNTANPPECTRDFAIEPTDRQPTRSEGRSDVAPTDRETLPLDARNFHPKLGPGCLADVHAIAGNGNADPSTTIFTISEKIVGAPTRSIEIREYERTEFPVSLVHAPDVLEDKALIVPEKNRPAGMRVNSIYSQERWHSKDPPIFFTDLKDRAAFQRAYSLPGRTETPSSQNRVNLRRSVRGEPPPHPAKLRKHRHGWTLHLARPLEGSGCTRSLVLLLIVVLALLGVGAVALYVVFEPEKLQIIQQYLRSSAGNSSSGSSSRDVGFPPATELLPRNETSTSTARPPPFSENPGPPTKESEPEIETQTETEVPVTGESTDNSTRYCDDCLPEEVCVALVDEEVPVCRVGLDPRDPTGCAGHCLINEQRCHRLDVDAFRCVQVEHYCLEDEWTCANTLCIPLDKRCDGHMNCYDHSDEYNCVCDPETHFQCGNETSCLPLEKRCDGKIDCWDAADEINCTLGRNLGWSCPMENEFTCSNGQCIAKVRFCDGFSDCADGSDEPHGCQGRCNKHEFTCQNSRCITKGMKCNGIDDCGDGTDERHCKDRRV